MSSSASPAVSGHGSSGDDRGPPGGRRRANSISNAAAVAHQRSTSPNDVAALALPRNSSSSSIANALGKGGGRFAVDAASAGPSPTARSQRSHNRGSYGGFESGDEAEVEAGEMEDSYYVDDDDGGTVVLATTSTSSGSAFLDSKNYTPSSELRHQQRKRPTMTTPMGSHFDVSGPLHKRRGGFGRKADKNWLERFFTLHGHVLCYYDAIDLDSVDPSKPRGRLNLSKEDTVAEMHTKQKMGAPTEFLVTVNIYVLGNKRKWEMCASDGDTQRRWYDALRKYDGAPEGAVLGSVQGLGKTMGEGLSKTMAGAKLGGSDRAGADEAADSGGGAFRPGSPGGSSGVGLVRRRRAKSADTFKDAPEAPVAGPPAGIAPVGAAELAEIDERVPAADNGTFQTSSAEWDEYDDDDEDSPFGGARLPLERQPLLDRGVVVSWAALNMAFYFLGSSSGGGGESSVFEATDRTFLMALFVSNLIVYHLVEHLTQRGEMRALMAPEEGGGGGAASSRSAGGRRGRSRGGPAVPVAARSQRAAKTRAGRGGAAARRKVQPRGGARASFARAIPAGSTMSRAPIKPGSDLEGIVQKHGPSSIVAVRACGGEKAAAGQYDGTVPHRCWNAVPSGFNLRVGPNYKKTKRKSPSAPALYDLYGMDFVRSERGALKSAADGFQLPHLPGVTDVDTGVSHVPPLIVVNTWLPAEEPGMFANPAGATGDAPTYTIVMYFVATEQTLAELRDFQNAGPAVKLLAEWCRRAETDNTFRGRFKAIGFVEEIEKTGLPSFIASYNGKPALVTKSGSFARRGKRCIEMTSNVHMWGYLARKGLHALRDKFPKFVVNVGFTIEGRCDEELPEVLLGGARVMNLDPARAVDDEGMAAIAAAVAEAKVKARTTASTEDEHQNEVGIEGKHAMQRDTSTGTV